MGGHSFLRADRTAVSGSPALPVKETSARRLKPQPAMIFSKSGLRRRCDPDERCALCMTAAEIGDGKDFARPASTQSSRDTVMDDMGI